MQGMRLAHLAIGLFVLGGPAAAETVTILTADCLWLERHVPAADVAYQPGIDAEGRPVAPADLPGSPTVTLPEGITIEIDARLGHLLRLPPGLAAFDPEAKIGRIWVSPSNGRAYFENQPLEDEATAEFAAACAQRLPRQR